MKQLIIILVLLPVCYYAVTTYSKLQIAKRLVAEAESFSKVTSNFNTTLLVLGDSTGVGVGADNPNDTVAALWSKEINATHVENYAVSGATIEDLAGQIKNAQQSSYDYVLIQIGGNDIIRFHSLRKDMQILEAALQKLPGYETLHLLSAGNVGNTTFFPWFMDSPYTKRTLQYHSAFSKLIPKYDGVYVNLYVKLEDDVFEQNPEKYFSADGLHPSSAGYGVWFEKLIAADK